MGGSFPRTINPDDLEVVFWNVKAPPSLRQIRLSPQVNCSANIVLIIVIPSEAKQSLCEIFHLRLGSIPTRTTSEQALSPSRSG